MHSQEKTAVTVKVSQDLNVHISVGGGPAEHA